VPERLRSQMGLGLWEIADFSSLAPNRLLHIGNGTPRWDSTYRFTKVAAALGVVGRAVHTCALAVAG
jgi:hypothetical protein